MSDITLESLIQEHKERIGLLKYQHDPPGCLGFSYYYYDDSSRNRLFDFAKQRC